MIQVHAHSWKEWAALSPAWDSLAPGCQASFFLSTAWVDTWLRIYGPQLEPEIVLLREGGEPVAACLLVRRTFWRKFVPVRRIYLNCAGEDEAESTCIEYNRLLCLPGRERDSMSALRAHLNSTAWDEMALDGWENGGEDLASGCRIETRQRPCYYVDLASLRAAGSNYDSVLSSNTRQQIRRSIRLYEETYGPLQLAQAAGPGEALRFLDELAELHQKSWTGRGKAGVFASERFFEFHRGLIRRSGWPDGSVHLLRVTAGTEVIGLLHSFFHGGRIWFYQSGFAYQADNRGKPGLVTHYLAINHYLANDARVAEYDLLAGDSQYKRSLAKDQRTLEWIVAQRPTWRVRALNLLRRARG